MESELLEKALQLCYAYYISVGNPQEATEKMFNKMPASEVFRVCACICKDQAEQKYLGKSEQAILSDFEIK